MSPAALTPTRSLACLNEWKLLKLRTTTEPAPSSCPPHGAEKVTNTSLLVYLMLTASLVCIDFLLMSNSKTDCPRCWCSNLAGSHKLTGLPQNCSFFQNKETSHPWAPGSEQILPWMGRRQVHTQELLISLDAVPTPSDPVVLCGHSYPHINTRSHGWVTSCLYHSASTVITFRQSKALCDIQISISSHP